MTEVFICYAHKDDHAALPVVEAMRQAGFKVYEPLGKDVFQRVGEINFADCVVVLWSNAAMKSDWMQQELRHATYDAWSTDRLVLASLDDTPLPVGLRDLPIIPFRPGFDSATKQLIKRVQDIRNSRGTDSAEAPQQSRSDEPVRRSQRRGSSNQVPQPSARSNGSTEVFISYSHRDIQIVDQLANEIEQLGHAVWIDRESTGPGRFAAKIVSAIRKSRLVALMCSQNAFASDHVIREVYIAGDCKKPFIIFQLDPTEFPDEVLYFVSGFPRVSVSSIDAQLRSQIAKVMAT